jgi:hypothetical protein
MPRQPRRCELREKFLCYALLKPAALYATRHNPLRGNDPVPERRATGSRESYSMFSTPRGSVPMPERIGPSQPFSFMYFSGSMSNYCCCRLPFQRMLGMVSAGNESESKRLPLSSIVDSIPTLISNGETEAIYANE